MITATTTTVEGRPIQKLHGIVSSEIIFGANFWKDAGANVADFFGGRVREYEKVFQDAREEALAEIERKASSLGANAVLGVQLRYVALGERNQILMATACGTAVSLGLTEPELQAQVRSAAEDKVSHYAEFNGQRRGPFSISQMRQLLVSGKVSLDTPVLSGDGSANGTVRRLCGFADEED